MKLFLNILAVILIIGGLFVVGNYVLGPVLQEQYSPAWAKNPPAPQVDKSKEVSIQEVNNLGYAFYLGQIDTSNTVITDDLKTEITKIVYDAHFPKSILKNTPIVIVNSLALKDGLYIPTSSGNLNVGSFSPNFLYEGGIYAKYSNGGAVIYINKTTLEKNLLTDVLTHELGHAIGNTLTDTDWKKYYGLRNIPIGTAREGGLWNLSPQEDFAEVYKNIFTGLSIKTFYGVLIKNSSAPEVACKSIHDEIYKTYADANGGNGFYMSDFIDSTDKVESAIEGNSQLQNCRRDVMTNSTKYPEDYKWGVPYKSFVGTKTKEFINSIL